MTVVICSHTERCWCSPPPLWPRDQDRWELFRASINSRIMATRRTQGRDDIGTFSSPIPARVETVPLPIGRVAPLPTNHNDRDEHGRFAARRRSA